MRRLLTLLLTAALLLSACGAGAQPKEFAVEELTLTLDSTFKELSMDGFTGGFQSQRRQILVMILREDKSLFQGTVKSVDEYADLVKDANAASGKDIGTKKTDQGIPYYEYANEDGKYRYYSALFESEGAFWIVNFATSAQKYDALVDTFQTFAKSVKIGK